MHRRSRMSKVNSRKNDRTRRRGVEAVTVLKLVASVGFLVSSLVSWLYKWSVMSGGRVYDSSAGPVIAHLNSFTRGAGEEGPRQGGRRIAVASLFQNEPASEGRRRYDAYGISHWIGDSLARSEHRGAKNANGEAAAGSNSAALSFLQEAASMRSEFASLYGGEDAARVILERALTTFPLPHGTDAGATGAVGFESAAIPEGLIATARRLLLAERQSRPFRVSFGGYSVTAGRGNYFQQSFPFVFQKLLAGPLGTLLHVRLDVRNAAIGGVPSFPYGWCLPNFLGDRVDAVGWDYSMNEPDGVTEGMEAYVRRLVYMDGDSVPLFIAKDTHMATDRRAMLDRYVRLGILTDPLVIHTDPAVQPILTNLEEPKRPLGFQNWRQFGAPPGAPGMSSHHPAVKEHRFIAWTLAMHFLSALELIAASRLGLLPSLDFHLPPHMPSRFSATLGLPSPNISDAARSSVASSVLYGFTNHDQSNIANATVAQDNASWQLNPLSCATSFEPILRGDLQDLILSGTTTTEDSMALDLMFPKGAMFYNTGWVLDLAADEKKAKHKLLRYGGLGFLDSKKAYFGVKNSGPLRLFIPPLAAIHITTHNSSKTNNIIATDLFKSIIVCETNRNRASHNTQALLCDMQKDVSYTIGGSHLNPSQVNYIRAHGVSYLGNDICVYLPIPKDATLVTDTRPDHLQHPNNTMGLELQIAVVNPHLTVKDGACSVSHVVWENILTLS